ncbi:hypothetical protein ACFS07_28675 [Undibacterium arcticum]
MVRCGACKQVFNGVEHLLRPDEAAPAALEVPSELTPVSALVTAPEGASQVAPAEPTGSLDFGIFFSHRAILRHRRRIPRRLNPRLSR